MGKGWKLKDGNDLVVIIIGFIGKLVVCVIECVEVDIGIFVVYYDFCFFKLFDEELLYEVGKKFCYIVMIEDGIIKGGMGCVIFEFMVDNGYYFEIRCIGVLD